MLFLLLFLLYAPPSVAVDLDSDGWADGGWVVPPLPPAEMRVQSAVLLTRHGDRTPLKLYPRVESQWQEGLGQLTRLGMRQHYDLGSMFRTRYVDNLKFLSGAYAPSELYAQSTSKDRTLMSAQSFLFGLYPPGTGPDDALPYNLQPVPVHASSRDLDDLLYAYKSCPLLKARKKQVKASPAWSAMEKETEPLRRYLSDFFGFDVSLKDLTGLYTLLESESRHNHTSVLALTPAQRREMARAARFLLHAKFPSRQLGLLGSGNLLSDITRRFALRIEIITGVPQPEGRKKEAKKKEKDLDKYRDTQAKWSGQSEEVESPRLTFFSAHDGTILAVLSALGFEDYVVPAYASWLLFELQHNITDGEFSVVMYYDGEMLGVPGCTRGRCPFNEFKRMGGDGDWRKQCEVPKESEGGDAAQPPAPDEGVSGWVVGGGSLLALLAGVAVAVAFR